MKLVVFDLDNTLAKLGKGIIQEDLELLKKIEKKGATVAICSGKPTYYLCGFMRQVELEHPVLIGENGAVIQFGVDLPPKRFYILPYSSEAKKTISLLEEKVCETYPDMWFQPNQVGLTPFPKSEEEFEGIEAIIETYKDAVRDVIVYRHVDSFDITPCGIDKKAGIQYLGQLLGIIKEETIAVGDGVNDYPMFEYAGHAVGVNVKETEKVDHNFNSATKALEYIYGII